MSRRWGLLALLLVACGTEPFDEAERRYREGDLKGARQGYELALERASPQTRPRVLARLGLTLRKLGDPQAEARLRRSIELAEAAGDGAQKAISQRYLGRLLADGGRGEEAAALYEAALRWHQSHGPAAELMKVLANRAALAWTRGRYEVAYEAWLDLHGRASVAGQVSLEASALSGMAMVLARGGELAEAGALAKRAATIHERSGRRDAWLRARLNGGVYALVHGDWALARRIAQEALGVAREMGHAAAEAQASLLLGNALLDGGEALPADLVKAAVRTSAKAAIPGMQAQAAILRGRLALGKEDWAGVHAALSAPLPDAESRALGGSMRARAFAAEGRDAEAKASLEGAVEAFEALRAELPVGRLHAFFITERVRVYETLIATLAEAKDAAGVRRVVGLAKARALGDTLRGRASLRPTAPSSLKPARAGLRVVEYFLLPQRVVVLDGERVQLLSLPRPLIEARVRALMKGIREGGEAWRAEAAWLSKRLLDPVGVQPGKPMAFLPHGALHALPFEALPWAGGLLVDAVPVLSAPSAAFLARGAPPPTLTGAVLIANPDGDLPGASAEVKEAAARLPGARVLLGAAATEAAARSASAPLLHFAVHGRSTEEGTYLQLGAESTQDGRLWASEIASLRLQRPRVVLSVCDSAKGQPNRGDEIVGVVDRAFLAAGARSVIASRWPVDDEASVLFMRRFYERLAVEGTVAAFHSAQLALRRGELKPRGATYASRVRGLRPAPASGQPADLSQPYFWAAFSLRGDHR